MSTTMENTKICECDCDCEGEFIFSELDTAKMLLKATDAVKLDLEDQKFDEALSTLESYLLENKIDALSDSIASTLGTIKSVKANEKTREDLKKMLCIFTVALRNFISEEENRKLDILAIRRVGLMLAKTPAAFYDAVFGKRD